MTQLAPNLYQITLGAVNTFLIDSGDGLILIDAGYPDQAQSILDAIRSFGKSPKDLRHILITHAHTDHIGSLATLQRETGAETYVHSVDAGVTRGEGSGRAILPAPGLFNQLLFRFFIAPALKMVSTIEPAEVSHEVNHGDVLPLAGDIEVIFTPGHSLGHVSYLWKQHGGVLFVGDAAANFFALAPMIAYEDYPKGVVSLKKIAGYSFEMAGFGHGRAIKSGAAAQFRRKFA